jgi:hypothetical protein
MKVVAAIGTRAIEKVQENRVVAYRNKLRELWEDGWYLHTGGALGADLEAIELFTSWSKEKRVKIFLPWNNYNLASLITYRDGIDVEIYENTRHLEATKSVDTYHPIPAALTHSARKLLARNYLLIEDADMVLALPEVEYKGGPPNKIGGTYHGIRIAMDLDKDLITL